MAPTSSNTLGVVLIGHGSPATDCPPQLVGELMSLEWRQHSTGHGHEAPGGRAAELDAQIRDWPRRADNDPYQAGLERLAQALRPLLPTSRFTVGYNEFCRPSIAEAIEQVIAQGATRVLVLPTMLTPGGVHSEIDIPRALDEVQRAHPDKTIEYLWPYDLQQIAGLLASHVERAARGPLAHGTRHHA
ncbi:MAG: CbiX/SirB N-terminal domain-containing protein [Candidatus Omnitrophica bacterium]|nr:CbiX/SirB N-terminal domain-containing protein [Candidatus Omnitrophota bacterium]